MFRPIARSSFSQTLALRYFSSAAKQDPQLALQIQQVRQALVSSSCGQQYSLT